jgi:hypothetical protein
LRTTALGSEPYSNGNIPALLAAKQGADAAAKHAEEAMLAAQAADLAKTKFLANMAHELRTPLNAIIGFSEIIKLDNIQARERYPQYAEYIHDAGIPLLNIINGLLNLALMNFLPALRNGEAIAVGEGVAMPIRICFSLLPDDRRPKSATTSFTSAWSTGSDGTQIERTVERWRRGMRHASG